MLIDAEHQQNTIMIPRARAPKESVVKNKSTHLLTGVITYGQVLSQVTSSLLALVSVNSQN